MLRSSEIKPLFVDLSHCDKSFLFFTDSTHTAYGRPLLFTFTSSTHTAYGTLSPCPRLCLAHGTRCDRLQSALLWVWPKSYLNAHLYAAHRVWSAYVLPLPLPWCLACDFGHTFIGMSEVVPLRSSLRTPRMELVRNDFSQPSCGMTEVVPFFTTFFWCLAHETFWNDFSHTSYRYDRSRSFFFRFFLFQFCAQFWSYFFSKRVNIPKESLIYLNIYLTSDVEDITKNLWNLF